MAVRPLMGTAFGLCGETARVDLYGAGGAAGVPR
jgi:hypothetical protein